MKWNVMVFVFVLITSFAYAQKSIPSVNVKTIQGENFNTSEIKNDGKPIIICFFATWCKPCMTELKNIADEYDDWREETGVKLYAVSIDDSRASSKVAPLVKGQGWEYEILLDDNGDFNIQDVAKMLNDKLIHRHPHVFGNEKTKVTEAGGNTWRTKEPAIMYFFKDEWFNIICQLKKDGVYYYCNIASPYIIEDETIKYIDYDLDLRVFPTGEYKILDRLEYKRHQKLMRYSEELSAVIEDSLEELITLYNNKSEFFDSDYNKNYYHMYLEVKPKKSN